MWVRSVPNSRFVKFEKPTKSTSTLPFWKTSLPNARVSEAKSGKIERHRMMTTLGQMKVHRAAPSDFAGADVAERPARDGVPAGRVGGRDAAGIVEV